MYKQKNNEIWSKWIFVVSVLFLIMGIFMFFIAQFLIPELLELYFIEITGLNFSDISTEEKSFIFWLFGEYGTILIAWGSILVFLTYNLLHNQDEGNWTAITISLTIWYLSDCIISMIVGFYMNLMMNSILFLLALPPLITNRHNIIKGIKKSR